MVKMPTNSSHFEEMLEDKDITFGAPVGEHSIDLWWSKNDGLGTRKSETGLERLSKEEKRKLEFKCLVVWRLTFGPLPNRKVYMSRVRIE